MLLPLTDPFDTLFRLQRDLESRLASDWLDNRTGGSGAFPPINLFQQGHDFVAVIELPGVAKSDLELQAKESTIRISGKKAIDYGDKVSVHRRERIAGSFDRTITLPVRIDPDRIKAEVRDGILAEGDKVGLGGGPAFVVRYATLMQQRGWIRTSRGWAGPFKTKYGQWPGIIELAGDLVKPLIRNPPAALRQHPQWSSFHEQASGWYRIDLAESVDRDPNAVIRHVENMIVIAGDNISDAEQDRDGAANSGSRSPAA